MMRKRILLILALATIALPSLRAQNVIDLIIAEVLAVPDSTGIVDDYGRQGGWIEIFNTSQGTVNIAVMGAEGAVAVLYAKEIKAEEDPEKQKELAEAKKKEYNDLFCNPYNAAKYGYIDDVIEPRNTRFRVIRALEQLAGKRQNVPAKKHDNLPL